MVLSILVIDDEPNIRKTLKISLEAGGHRVVTVGNSKDALEEAGQRYFDLAFVDLRLGVESGMDLIPMIKALCPWIKCIVITAYASIDSAVEAMRRGAFDYLHHCPCNSLMEPAVFETLCHGILPIPFR